MSSKEILKNMLSELINVLSNKGKIYCIGHDQIDVDAFISGLLASKLFNFLGFDSEFIILQPVTQNETYTILKSLTNIEMKDYENTIEDSKRTLFLVDHYETSHAGTVIGCIDHHPTLKNNTYPFSYSRPATASAYMLYELMQAANYPLTAEEAKYIVLAMLVDTVGFKSSKTNIEEVKIAKELSRQYGLNYELLEKSSFCLTPIDTMTAEEIVLNGLKKYNFNGHNVWASYIQVYGMPSEQIIRRWLKDIEISIISSTLEMFVFIVFDLQGNKTYEYTICKNYYQHIIYDGILSRGKDIMPRVERYFSKF